MSGITRVLRVTMSVPHYQHNALHESLQLAELPATMAPGVGITKQWGIEPIVVLEFAGKPEVLAKVYSWTLSWLREHGEESAYATWNGSEPTLWYANGRLEKL